MIAPSTFLRALAGIFALAFWSLGTQCAGLYRIHITSTELRGRCADSPSAVRMRRRAKRTWQQRVSSLMWIADHFEWDSKTRVSFLKGHAWTGGLVAVGMAAGVVPVTGIASTLVWASLNVLYLSLTNNCGTFTRFQWDVLLVEVGWGASMLSLGLSEQGHWGPVFGWLAWVYLRVVLFKLMFSSGVVKFSSGCPTWRDLSAMQYHHFTQCIPHRMAWFIRQYTPDWGHKFSVLVNHAVEIAIPWLLWAPVWGSWVAPASAFVFGSFTLLNLGIVASGNYGFFNWLTIVLSLTAFPASLPDSACDLSPVSLLVSLVQGLAVLTYVLPNTLLSVLRVQMSFRRLWPKALWSDALDTPAQALLDWYQLVSPLRVNSGYGLFARMTTTRPEVTLLLAHDDGPWTRLVLPYKPGPLDRAPRWTPFHMPRLDWQFWFLFPHRYIACGQGPPLWLQGLAVCLMRGDPDIAPLFGGLETRCEDGALPTRVRVVWSFYEFEDRGALDDNKPSPNWWKRVSDEQAWVTWAAPDDGDQWVGGDDTVSSDYD